MDEKSAWKNFEKSGEIADYLEYCKYRNTEEENNSGKKSKSKWNNNSGK